MMARIEFVLDEVEENGFFGDMYDRVHVDEKWFYLTTDGKRYYLSREEPAPHRTCQHKSHIPKVMFLCAVARSQFDANGNCIFDGKIGIWPFAVQVAAQRNSHNRQAGTLEWKCVNVNKDAYRQMIVQKVVPAIAEKWPAARRNRPIRIQQDNATSHISSTDPLFVAAVAQTGLDISLYCQPSNSPDTNVLDLVFFRAIQSLQYQMSPRTTSELINHVNEAWNLMQPTKLNDIFLTLQACLNEILKDGGGNAYSVPHLAKRRIEREEGVLPVSLRAHNFLDDLGDPQADGVEINNNPGAPPNEDGDEIGNPEAI